MEPNDLTEMVLDCVNVFIKLLNQFCTIYKELIGAVVSRLDYCAGDPG